MATKAYQVSISLNGITVGSGILTVLDKGYSITGKAARKDGSEYPVNKFPTSSQAKWFKASKTMTYTETTLDEDTGEDKIFEWYFKLGKEVPITEDSDFREMMGWC